MSKSPCPVLSDDKREVAACRSVCSPASALAILRVDASSSSLGLHALFVRGIDTGQKGSIRAD